MWLTRLAKGTCNAQPHRSGRASRARKTCLPCTTRQTHIALRDVAEVLSGHLQGVALLCWLQPHRLYWLLLTSSKSVNHVYIPITVRQVALGLHYIKVELLGWWP